jgi:hypothetical protein
MPLGRDVPLPPPAARKRLCERSGSVAILFALMLTALLGFIALGTEVGFVLLKQRQMQTAASAAALGGATALMTGHPTAAVEADAIATSAGFQSGTVNGVVTTVTVNNPPKAGNHIGAAGYVEVTILQPQKLPLSALFGVTVWNINARAVAMQGTSGGDCLLQLDTTGNPGLWINEGATVNAGQCGVAVNGSGVNALEVVGGGVLDAASVTVVGTVDSANGTITSTKAVQTGQSAVTDPYAGVAVPTYSGCTSSQVYWSGNNTFSPGTYCGGMSFSQYGTETLNPGVYIMNGGYFSVGSVTVNGTGVTIVLTGSGTNYATMAISGGTTNLSAPTTGATAGLVFFQDPLAPTGAVNSISGGGTLNVTGAMYFPSEYVEYSNGGAITTSGCTQLIAATIVFFGGATFNNTSCASAGVSTIGASPSQLTE